MGHVNDAQNSRIPTLESSFINSIPGFNQFKKPRLSETNWDPIPKIPLSVNRSKLSVPFRSQLCLLFQRGKCFYGENCHYAHSVNDLRNPGPLSVTTERNWNEDCKFEIRECYLFSAGKTCPYGDRCRFLHKFDQKARSMHREVSVISVVNGGRGRSGNDENEGKGHKTGEVYRTVLLKTRLCHKWERFGFCHYGDRCVYAHGLAELRGLDSEAQQGHFCNSKLKVLASQLKDGTGIKTADNVPQVKGKRCFMKWDVAKIGRVYGDWPDDTLDFQVSVSEIGT